MIAIDGVSPELLVPPANASRVTLHPRGMAPRIVNLDEWSSHLLQRLRRQASITGDPELAELHEELSSYPGVSLEPPHDEFTGAEIVLPLRVRNGDDELEFFSTVSTFGKATAWAPRLAPTGFTVAGPRRGGRGRGRMPRGSRCRGSR